METITIIAISELFLEWHRLKWISLFNYGSSSDWRLKKEWALLFILFLFPSLSKSTLLGPVEKVFICGAPGRSHVERAGLSWTHPHTLTRCLKSQHQSHHLWVRCCQRMWDQELTWKGQVGSCQWKFNHAYPEGDVGGTHGLVTV